MAFLLINLLKQDENEDVSISFEYVYSQFKTTQIYIMFFSSSIFLCKLDLPHIIFVKRICMQFIL